MRGEREAAIDQVARQLIVKQREAARTLLLFQLFELRL